MANFYQLPNGQFLPADQVRQNESGNWSYAADGGWLPIMGADGNFATPVATNQSAPTPPALWQQLGMNSVQHDRLAGMGLSDADIGSRLQSYMQANGATQADPMNWGDAAMNRAMGLGSNPALEAAQQKAIALTQQKNQSLNGQTDYGFLPMAAGIALGGTVGPWLASSLGGGTLGSLGANVALSGANSALFGGDPAQAMGKSLLTGGLNAATGGALSPSNWMNGFNTGAQNINSGIQVAGGTGGTGLGGGMFENIDWNDPMYGGAGGVGYDYGADGGGFGVGSPGTFSGTNYDPSAGSGIFGGLGSSGLGGVLRSVFGGGSGGSGGGLFGGYGPLLGAGLGALLGGQSASSKPAGTVTSVQDIPDWQKPYVMGLLGSAAQTFGGLNTSGQNLLPGAQQQLAGTIAGQYTNPNTNPYNSQVVDDLMGQAQSRVNAQFSGQNFGSSAHNESLGRGLMAAALPYQSQNYTQERTNQLNASTAAPGFATNSINAQFAPQQAYGNIVGQRFGSTTSNPYFSNTAGGILSGALGGLALGKAFG